MRKIILFIVVAMMFVTIGMASVVVASAVPLEIIAPSDIIREAKGLTTHVANLGEPTINGDVPAGTTPTNDAPEGNNFPLGATDVVWTINNGAETSTDIQIVTVEDTTGPTIVAPSDITQVSTGLTTHVPDLGTATASDLVDNNPKITNNAPVGNNFPVGDTTITWKACDNLNNCNVDAQIIKITDAQNTQLKVSAPADITKAATGVNTIFNIGTATSSGGVPPVDIVNNAPVDGFPVGETIVTWIATDNVGTIAQDTQLITVTEAKVKLAITNYTPEAQTIEDTAPSNIKFGVELNQVANVAWSLDGVVTQSNQSVKKDSYRTNIPERGSHVLTLNAQNGTDSVSHTWNWDIKGTLHVSANPEFVGIGQPTNVTIKVDRRCGIENGDDCTTLKRLPASGATISLSGAVNGGGVVNDTTGEYVVAINTTNNGTINVTASKSGYLSNYTNIVVGVAPTPVPTTPPSSGSSGGSSGSSSGDSGSSGGGGGGGGSGTAEPYDNILKYEIQEKAVFTTPVSFKYVTPELSIYDVLVTSSQSNIASLRIEVLKGTSKLVGSPAPGVVYKNINAWVDYKRIKNATMKFKVENSWIGDNGLGENDVRLSKWDNVTRKWSELGTSVTGKDGTYTYFESDTNSFSSFAINAIKALPSSISETSTPSTSGTIASSPVIVNQGAAKHNDYTSLEIGIVAAIVILVVYLLRMNRN